MNPQSRIAALAGALVTVLAADACDRPGSSPYGPGGVSDSSEQVMFGARTVLTANGIRRGDVAGDTVRVFDQATRFEFRSVRAQFVTTEGRPLSTLTAPSATYLLSESVLRTRGKFTITSDTSHRQIEGTDVRFDVNRNQLASDSAFVATAGTRRLTGVGFTADPGLFTVTCLRSCVGSLGR